MPRRLNLETEGNAALLQEAKKVLSKFSAHLPLTVRQVFYQLVGSGTIPNDAGKYRTVSRVLVAARLKGEIDWDDIDDRTRSYTAHEGFSDASTFINEDLNALLQGYHRHLTQDQPRHVEVWVEKDALSSICKSAVRPYYVPVMVCRGFPSVTILHDFVERAGEHSTILYFGDFDPSGKAIAVAVEKSLKTEMNMKDVKVKWCALTPQDIKKYKLPHNPDAIKKGDSRSAAHVAEYGKLSVELDALPPDVLVNKIRKAIEGALDMEEFQRQKAQDKKDLEEIGKLRKKVECDLAIYRVGF